MVSPVKRQKLQDDFNCPNFAVADHPSFTSPLLPIIHPSAFPPPSVPPLPWSYRSKVMSAPMVRVSTLPFRLLCRHYGADVVYSEELIANKLQHCTRHANAVTGTIDFLSPSQSVVLSTYADEPLVCQLGASNAVDALRAAEVVAADVRAVDLNMGCPERFSTQGGMGSALLRSPQVAADILQTLRRNLPASVAVTCKIRLLDRLEDTVELMRQLEAAGADAIAVHARRVPDRPRHRALTEQLPLLFSLRGVPCVYNGDLFTSTAIPEHVALPANTSVLVGRGAMYNPSIFRRPPAATRSASAASRRSVHSHGSGVRSGSQQLQVRDARDAEAALQHTRQLQTRGAVEGRRSAASGSRGADGRSEAEGGGLSRRERRRTWWQQWRGEER